MSNDEIKAVAQDLIEEFKKLGKPPKLGTVLKGLVGAGGKLDGKAAEPSTVKKVVERMLE